MLEGIGSNFFFCIFASEIYYYIILTNKIYII